MSDSRSTGEADPDQSLGTLFQRPLLRHGALVALGLALLVYYTSLTGEFVFDDESLILENPLVTDSSRIREILVGPHGPAYRPIRTLSYAIDHRIWDVNPAGYHLSNILIHGFVTWFVFIVAQLLGLSGPITLLSCALFAVHPVHTDAVTYISGRRDVLSALFYLAGFACFLVDRKRPGALPLIGLFAAYILGIGTKEMAVTLPAVCLAYHFTWGRTAPGEKSRGPLFYLAFFSLGIAFSYYAVCLEKDVTLMPTYHGGSRTITLLSMTRVFWHYVGLLIFPWTLSADYSINAFPLSKSLFEFRTFVAVIGTAGMGILPFLLARKRSAAAFGLFWFWLTLAPVSQIIPHTEMVAEHYLYLPSVAYCIALGALLAHPSERFAKARIVAALLVLILFSARTLVRNEDWQTSYSLWSKTVLDFPECARARTNLGLALEKQGRLKDAEFQYREALRIMPDDPFTLNNLGSLYLQLGKPKEGKPFLERAVKRVPSYFQALNNLGCVECELGELVASKAHLERALEIRSNHLSSLVNLAMTLKRLGPSWYGRARELYATALAIDPENLSAYNNLGALLLAAGKPQEAVEVYKKLIRLRDDVGRFWMNLARAESSAGMCREAEESLVRAVTLDPGNGPLCLEAVDLALDLKLSHVAHRLYKRTQELGVTDRRIEARLKGP